MSDVGIWVTSERHARLSGFAFVELRPSLPFLSLTAFRRADPGRAAAGRAKTYTGALEIFPDSVRVGHGAAAHDDARAARDPDRLRPIGGRVYSVRFAARVAPSCRRRRPVLFRSTRPGLAVSGTAARGPSRDPGVTHRRQRAADDGLCGGDEARQARNGGPGNTTGRPKKRDWLR